jgi:hypothetical protein
VRRAGTLALALLLALAGTIGVIAFLQARDDANIGGERSGPGVQAPGETAERLRRGNVLLTYRRQEDGAALRALAEDVAGPPDPALEEAGQAILVERRPDQGQNVVARAWERRLEAPSAADPAVREFAEAWLGQGEVE